MRESHPYRKVSVREETLLCNPSVTSLKSHRFIVTHTWGGSACRRVAEKVFLSLLATTCPSISHSGIGRLFSQLPHFFPLFLQLSFSSNLSLFPAPPPLLNQLWPSSLLLPLSVSPFSRVGGHTWVQYDGSSFIPPLSCLCMSLSVPVVLFLTCPCTTPPHSSIRFPSFMLLL